MLFNFLGIFVELLMYEAMLRYCQLMLRNEYNPLLQVWLVNGAKFDFEFSINKKM